MTRTAGRLCHYTNGRIHTGRFTCGRKSSERSAWLSPTTEPLVACHSICELPRADDRSVPVPYPPGIFEIQLDFQRHEVQVSTSEGSVASRPLRAGAAVSFYHGLFEILTSLGLAVEIDMKPQEVADPVPFDRDFANCSYEGSTRIVSGAYEFRAPKFSRDSARSSLANAALFTSIGAASISHAHAFGRVVGPAYVKV